MMRVKLYWKFTSIFCLALVICLIFGYFYLSGHLKTQFEKDLRNNLKHQLLLTKHFLEVYLENNKEINDLDTFADRVSKELALRVTIIDRDGNVLGDSELEKEEIKNIDNHINRPEIQDALKRGFGVSKRFSRTIKKYLLYMAVPFTTDRLLGFVRVALPLVKIEIFDIRLKETVAFSFLLVFGLGFLFTYFISRIISKPLAEMAVIASAMAEGDFSKKPLVYSRDEIGDLAKALSYMSDEIKDNIERIKQETAKLDAVLSSMIEGVMVVNDKGKIVLMNPSLRKQFLIDFPPEGKTPIEVVRNQSIQKIVDRLLNHQDKFASEEIFINQPEESIFKINASSIIRNDVLEGAVLVFHNITELRRLERIRQDFVANVSHELRTPVSNIKGYTETLLEGASEDKENLKDFLEIIYKESNRLSNLIDDLLDLSRIESGKIKMILEPIDIRPIIDRCIAILDKSIKAKEISVSMDIPHDLPKVLADDTRLTQVFLNLLDNAVKYNKEKGSIHIKAFVKEKVVQVEVSDTGIGIPESDLPRIFERFYRVDKARSRELGGTGLGLSIVKHIITSHGGQIWATSELGRGSTFSFTIPYT